jgi:large subunit ribosomal protein L9
VKIKLHADITFELPFDVVSENPIEPVATEEKPAAEKSEKGARPDRRPRKDSKA